LDGAHLVDFDKLIKEFDANGDGQISFDEFCAMMKKIEK
jgi:Ca2+-binding EF-hand superfamily protein